MKYGPRNALRPLLNVGLPSNQSISLRPRLPQVVTFILFVILTFLLSFPFLTENSQVKNIMCVLILLTIIFGVHNDENFFQSQLA